MKEKILIEFSIIYTVILVLSILLGSIINTISIYGQAPLVIDTYLIFTLPMITLSIIIYPVILVVCGYFMPSKVSLLFLNFISINSIFTIYFLIDIVFMDTYNNFIYFITSNIDIKSNLIISTNISTYIYILWRKPKWEEIFKLLRQ